jgi:hypothetical protein
LSIDRSLPAVTDETRELCHYRHMWDRVDSNHWRAAYGEPLTLRCMRCGTEFRAEIQPNTGGYMHRRYVHPPGYLYAKTERRLSHAERRAWIVQQSIFNARKTRTTTKRRKAS